MSAATGEPATLRLSTTLEPRGPAAAIVLTDDQVASLGAGKAFPVRVVVNGTVHRGRVGRMGGENLIGFSKQARAEVGVEIGDTVDVEITVDAAPREEVLHPALAAALDADPAARAAFDRLAPSHRKEHARSVAEAKREETRDRRVAAVLAALRGES